MTYRDCNKLDMSARMDCFIELATQLEDADICSKIDTKDGAINYRDRRDY